MTETITADTVRAITDHLPGTWVLTRDSDNHVTATRTADALTLGFYLPTWGANGKTEVYHKVPREVLKYNEDAPRINVTLTRPAATLARDIERRLMGDAEALHVRHMAHVEQERVAAEAREATRQTLIQAGAHIRHRYQSAEPSDDFDGPEQVGMKWSHSEGKIRHGGDVDLEMHGISPDLAVAVVALVAGWGK